MTRLAKVRRRIAAAVVCVGIGLGSVIVTATAAEAQPSSHRITLDMSECGVMYLGTVGTCIVSLQSWMRMATGADILVDGYYGPETLAAVQEFQRVYVRNVTPSGHFGDNSRAALRGWFERAGGVEDGVPCDRSTGNGCDPGAAIPGINGGVYKTVGCVIVGAWNLGAGVFCDVVLD